MSDSYPIAVRGMVDYDRATGQKYLCAWSYHGAAGKCQQEAAGLAYHETLDTLVPFCEEHLHAATEEVNDD